MIASRIIRNPAASVIAFCTLAAVLVVVPAMLVGPHAAAFAFPVCCACGGFGLWIGIRYERWRIYCVMVLGEHFGHRREPDDVR